MSTTKQTSSVVFPQSSITGSVGDLARVLSEGTEVPEEFFFACGLTMLGWMSADDLKIDVGIHTQPRLYTVLLGASYDARKSTAMRKTISVFNGLIGALNLSEPPETIYGVGSAEGLIHRLESSPNLLLAYDELRAFVDKSKVQNSSLLPLATSLFESNTWDNETKLQSLSVRGANLSLIGCCTTDTYASMWSNEAIAIGFPNRLFVVSADRKQKVAWPQSPDTKKLSAVKMRLIAQLNSLPLKLTVSNDARAAWEQWYISLPSSEHSKRL